MGSNLEQAFITSLAALGKRPPVERLCRVDQASQSQPKDLAAPTYRRNTRAMLVDELELFRAIAHSEARALLIGRQALIALGIPVLTSDYDFWIHIDDAEAFNQALEPLDLVPSRSPEEARRIGRYVLENDEHIDVLVARSMPTIDGTRVAFDDVWERRQELELATDVPVALPSLDDLIATKRFAARPKDAEDVRLLEVLRSKLKR